MSSTRTSPAVLASRPSSIRAPQPQRRATTLAVRPLARAVQLALAASLVTGVGWTSPAQAQNSNGQAEGTSAAQAPADEVRQYNIPAGPLSRVLTRFSGEAGIFLVGATDLAQGKTSPGLNGQYSVNEALQELLAGTGLQYRFSDANTVTLAQAGEQDGDGPMRLGPITVEAQTETGTGPLDGFRASRSVSATNVDAPLIETPATVNVLTRDFLDTIQPRRFEDALAYVPGAGQEITLGNSDPVFSLRGFSTTGREGGIVVDGYQLNRRSYIPDLSLYERVDVLKGASGVLYGTARPGGIVNYIRKRPRFDLSFTRVESTVGSFDTLRASFDATGQVTDTLAYRFTATRQDANQTIHGDNDSSVPDDRALLNAGLTWLTPIEGEVRFNYEHYFIDQVFDPGIQFVNRDWTFNREPLTNPDQFSEREFDIFRVEYEQPIVTNWSTLVGVKYDTGDT